MKIGILTYWGVANYGAWAQAYALNKVLANLFPQSKVEHIAFLEKSHWDIYFASDEKGLNNFNYNWDAIPHTNFLTKEELEQYECDILITGADSIWEEIVTGVVNHDWHLIGKDMKCCRNIISYAPSSGIFDGKGGIPDEMVVGLRRYMAISVRDETTQQLVEKVLHKKVPIVVDPVLLWDFSQDINVKTPVFDKYIAVYGSSWNSGFVNETKRFAATKGLKLISLGFVNDWCDISFKRIELRAFEWIGMFLRADYVVTSTFHGLMMGINFEKQIKFCQVKNVKNRSQTLCKLLEIPDFEKKYNHDIDYSKIREKLRKSIIESKKDIDT